MINYVYSRERSKYINVKIFIIDACNYACYYCYNTLPRTHTQLNIHYIYLFIQNVFIRYNKKINIEIMGGEPTLHPKLLTLCEQLQSYDFIHNILIYTNFSQSINYYLTLLQNSKVKLDLSCHSINGKINLQFLNKLIQLNKYTNIINNITVSILIEPLNIDMSFFINQIISSTTRFTIDVIKIINDISSYQLSQSTSYYSANDEKRISNIINKLNKYEKKTIHLKLQQSNIFLSDIDARHFCAKQYNLFYNWTCLAGIRSFYIHSNGDCYSCQQYYEINMPSLFNIYNKYTFNQNPIQCKSHKCLCEQFVTKWKNL